MVGGQTTEPGHPPSTDERDSPAQPSCSSSPLKCTSHLGFSLGFPQGTVPDGFAIPFYFYDEFMKAHGFYDDVKEMLADPDFQSDFEVQDDMLDDLRDDIKDADTPQWIIDALTAMHDTYPTGQSLRYRSSTNNEDLPGFNGAGLYDSKTQDPDETEEDGIDKSLKGVFASLWTFRAFTEREFHRIDHLTAAMGVLVHPNYSDELANGVAVSFNPLPIFKYFDKYEFYYVNTQLGEDLVTNPEAHSMSEEILIDLLKRIGPYYVISTSNLVEPGELLMSDDQLEQLGTHLEVIHDHFKGLYKPGADEPFAMEIEFKITSDDILAIKQARPWVFSTPNETAPNRPPAFPSSETGRRTVAENTPSGQAIGAPVAATDPDSDTLTYTLYDPSGLFTIGSSTGQITVAANDSLDYETEQDYAVAVTATDTGGLTAETEVKVLVTDVNEPPVVSGETSVTFDEDTSITTQVARFTASDPEGDSFTWSVRGTDGSDFTIGITNGSLTFNSPPDHETQDIYNIIVVATDNAGHPNEGTFPVRVEVLDVNEAPEIYSGRDRLSYFENDTHPVETYFARDPDGTTAFTWSLSGTDRGDFVITSNGQLQFATSPDYERPADFGGNNMYNVTVRAYDGQHYGPKDVAVTVENVNEPPSTPTGRADIEVAENTTGTLARYHSTDPDRDDTVVWGVSGTDAGSFRIDNSGTLEFDGTPNFESPADSGGNNVYEFRVDAKDASFTSSYDVRVAVTPVDEHPVIAGETTVEDYLENGEGTVERYTATDPEGDTPITWRLSGADSSDFTLTDGILQFASPPDFDQPADSNRNNIYEVTIEATDTTDHTGRLEVDILVNNVDEPPVLTGPDTIDEVPENARNSRQVAGYTATDPERATISWSLSGNDDTAFSLSNGILTFKGSPDYESQSSYSIIVNIEAGGQTTTKAETVNVTNLEEPGTVMLLTLQPQEGTAFTAELEDPDNIVSAVEWQWYRTSSRGGIGTAVTNATSDSYTPVAADVGSYLRAVATYDDGHSAGKTAAAASAHPVQQRPPDPEPPLFPADGDYDRTIPENMPAGHNVGAPVTATDANNDRLTYTMTGIDAFEIIDSTGQLRTKAVLDHETGPTHTVTVIATDPGRQDDAIAVTITVSNVDEDPVVSGPTTVKDYNENDTATVGRYSAADPENSQVTWGLSGTDEADFEILNGTLTFKSPPDFESPADSNRNNEYQVTVQASDGTNTGRLIVAVIVVDVDEPGSVVPSVMEPRVNQRISVGLNEPDGIQSIDEWKWERGDPNSPCGAGSNWQLIHGATGSSYTTTADDEGKCIRATVLYTDRKPSPQIQQFITPNPVIAGPYFASAQTSRSIPENTPSGRNIGSTVQARHSLTEALRYSLGGQDAHLFEIDGNTGQLLTSGALDYETQQMHVVTVTASETGPSPETAEITVTVNVTDVCDGATSVPGTPLAPSVLAASNSSLKATWTAASGSCITGYDLQYRQSSNSTWSPPIPAGNNHSRDITGLSASTAYEVQIRARNSEGPGGWSQSGRGTTSSAGGGGSGGGGGGSGGRGSGGGGGFVAPPVPPRPVSSFQQVGQLFQPLTLNATLGRVWRFVESSQRWLFYDPRPEFAPFNTLRTVNVASDPPAVVAIKVTRNQQFRGSPLYAGWNFVPVTAEPLQARPRSSMQPVQQLFSLLTSSGALRRIWWLDSRTQQWQFYDPNPGFAPFNTLTSIDLAANPPVVLAVGVSRQTEFRGRTLHRGWNYVVMR